MSDRRTRGVAGGHPQGPPSRSQREASGSQLREFLEADRLGAQADPDFRERLRRSLWQLVRRIYGGRSAGSGPGAR